MIKAIFFIVDTLIKGKKLFTYSQSNKIINRKRKSIVDANMMVKPWFVKD